MTNEAIDSYCQHAVRNGKFLFRCWTCRHPDRNKTWWLPPHSGMMNCRSCDRCMYGCSTFRGEVCPRREPPVRKVKNRLGPDTHTVHDTYTVKDFLRRFFANFTKRKETR